MFKIIPLVSTVVPQKLDTTCALWMKMINKTSFEHGAPPGMISVFY